ncbi:hypothetical protein NDU88_002843 [Pleurodeles waltl]|uniref:L1 transposable element RRM domain-containing protein n=1 Tax=Pleurodeles waltl TaxID=8319 RepID=A0AAV7LDP3_PLEWA|nr:hypothetical protein NDU88_002843 [Pleurodeles waltl]
MACSMLLHGSRALPEKHTQASLLCLPTHPALRRAEAHPTDNHLCRNRIWVNTKAGRQTEAEQRISAVEDTVHTKSKQLLQIEKVLKLIAAKNKYLEARSRRNNLRIVGIPESMDTGCMEHHVERLLTTIFGADSFSTLLIVEQVHRSLAVRPPPDTPPRWTIAHILNYRDRDTALRMVRKRRALKFKGNEISIYPDFTVVVYKAHKKFAPMKQKTLQANITYAMLCPAHLRITYRGKDHIFTFPQQAGDYLKHRQVRDLRQLKISSTCLPFIHARSGMTI